VVPAATRPATNRLSAAVIRTLASDVRAFTSNAFLVTGERTTLVDPGANFDVVSRVRAALAEGRGGGLDAVVLTHTHEDHVGNVGAVREAFGVETWGSDPEQPPTDNPIADGEQVRIGDDAYRALHTPGHKDDHLCLYSPSAGVLFAGDLVFANGGFGRTDLAEGDRGTLVGSIERVLDAVDPSLRVLHAGHGPSVTRDAYGTIERAARSARFGQ